MNAPSGILPALLAALVLLGFITPKANAATPSAYESDFAAANQFYESGDYRKAAELYKEILKRHGHSSAVHANLGNALFRLGDPGRAALHFERALLLNPSHVEAAANLEFTRRSTAARTFPKTPWDRVYDHVTPGGIAWVTAAAGWASIIGIILWLRPSPLRAYGMIVTIMAAPLAAACIALLALSHGGPWKSSRAIVVADGAVARLAPATSSRDLLSLRPASQVEILSRRGEWVHVLLPDNTRGWLPSKDVEPIR